MDAFVISSLPSPMLETLQMAGPLRSADITPLHRYYGPSRHPLVFGRLPGFAGYTAYPAPTISRRDEEGFSSCSACPCHRAVAPHTCPSALERPLRPVQLLAHFYPHKAAPPGSGRAQDDLRAELATAVLSGEALPGLMTSVETITPSPSLRLPRILMVSPPKLAN